MLEFWPKIEVVRMSIGGKISINFGWQGPNRQGGGWTNGGLDVNVVDLQFQGVRTDVSVLIPDNIQPGMPQKIPFNCRVNLNKPREGSQVVKTIESCRDSLDVSIERMRNLALRVGFLQRNPNDRLNSIRTDIDVPLTLPEELVAGQTYCLVVKANEHLFLSASLIKE
jgi:hypothetical protein